MPKQVDYDLQLDKLRLDIPVELRDNFTNIENVLNRLADIIEDIDRRLTELEP